MRKIIKYTFYIVIGFLLLLPLARMFLVVDEQPTEAEVIITLSGDTGRLRKAVELYNKGYSSKIMLSNAAEPGTTPEEAVTLGVPEQDLLLETEATSTYTNALYTKTLMVEQGFDSAIVVSSDYHMRRVKLIFDQVYKNSGIELTYVSSLRNDEAWYRDKKNIRLTLKEFIKLPAYELRLYKWIDMEG
ncbi:YdcF family protein [Domibacillus indicus]|uniref:YdcF family protein n=1 Tax=Domibacillus indicus TaxID=1437523 RepID=UPI00203BAC8B|nr:YdcF family protein [Domibacillus indicus]MCM3791205.1 YdcF family protein [Domibacillus indicus]